MPTQIGENRAKKRDKIASSLCDDATRIRTHFARHRAAVRITFEKRTGRFDFVANAQLPNAKVCYRIAKGDICSL
jgi:hypothetical protein